LSLAPMNLNPFQTTQVLRWAATTDYWATVKGLASPAIMSSAQKMGGWRSFTYSPKKARRLGRPSAMRFRVLARLMVRVALRIQHRHNRRDSGLEWSNAGA
jgi:hypothetical protein